MKFLLFVSVFSAVFLMVYGAVAVYPPDPKLPNNYYSSETGQMNYGSERYLKPCARATCGDDGTIQIVTCGTIASRCGLTPVDPSQQYPDCCPKPIPC